MKKKIHNIIYTIESDIESIISHENELYEEIAKESNEYIEDERMQGIEKENVGKLICSDINDTTPEFNAGYVKALSEHKEILNKYINLLKNL